MLRMRIEQAEAKALVEAQMKDVSLARAEEVQVQMAAAAVAAVAPSAAPVASPARVSPAPRPAADAAASLQGSPELASIQLRLTAAEEEARRAREEARATAASAASEAQRRSEAEAAARTAEAKAAEAIAALERVRDEGHLGDEGYPDGHGAAPPPPRHRAPPPPIAPLSEAFDSPTRWALHAAGVSPHIAPAAASPPSAARARGAPASSPGSRGRSRSPPSRPSAEEALRVLSEVISGGRASPTGAAGAQRARSPPLPADADADADAGAYRDEYARRERERSAWEERERIRREHERRAYEELEGQRRDAEQREFAARMQASRLEFERQEAARSASLQHELTAQRERLAAVWQRELREAEDGGLVGEEALQRAAEATRAFISDEAMRSAAEAEGAAAGASGGMEAGLQHCAQALTGGSGTVPVSAELAAAYDVTAAAGMEPLPGEYVYLARDAPPRRKAPRRPGTKSKGKSKAGGLKSPLRQKSPARGRPSGAEHEGPRPPRPVRCAGPFMLTAPTVAPRGLGHRPAPALGGAAVPGASVNVSQQLPGPSAPRVLYLQPHRPAPKRRGAKSKERARPRTAPVLADEITRIQIARALAARCPHS